MATRQELQVRVANVSRMTPLKGAGHWLSSQEALTWTLARPRSNANLSEIFSNIGGTMRGLRSAPRLFLNRWPISDKEGYLGVARA